MMSSNTDSASDSESVLTSFSKVKKNCNWCKEYKPLYDGKPYCKDCAVKMYRECSRCHLPYPEEKSFTSNDRRCNSCQNKFLKEKERREKRNVEVNHPKKSTVSTSTKQPLKRPLGNPSQIPATETERETDTGLPLEIINILNKNEKKPKMIILF
jgi:hypothetical protein